MPNLRAGFVITANLPASPVIFTSDLLVEWVAPIPLDGSTMVEGTVCYAEVRGILAAGLGKAKTQIKTCKSTTRKYSIAKQLATYLSLVVWEKLLRFLTTNRVLLRRSVWVSALGVGLCSPSLLSPDTPSSAQPRLDISTVYMKPHMSILKIWSRKLEEQKGE